jgi:hypothetical protein
MPSLSNCCPSISRQARHWTKSFRGLGSHGLSGPPTHKNSQFSPSKIIQWLLYINKWLISHITYITIAELLFVGSYAISNSSLAISITEIKLNIVVGSSPRSCCYPPCVVLLNSVCKISWQILLLCSAWINYHRPAAVSQRRTSTQVPWDLHLWTPHCLQFCTTEDATKAERAGCHLREVDSQRSDDWPLTIGSIAAAFSSQSRSHFQFCVGLCCFHNPFLELQPSA